MAPMCRGSGDGEEGQRIARIRQNTRTARPDDLDAVLTGAGFTVHQESSHKTYRRSAAKVTIPQHTPFLKPVYVRAAPDLLDQLGVETDNADDTEQDD